MKLKQIIFWSILLLPTSCLSPTVEYSPAPTLPATVPELIIVLSSNNDEARIGAAYALAARGSAAESAIPALIENLNDADAPYDVRMSAAYALAAFGSAAAPAIPSLVNVLQTDFVLVRRAAVTALGQIGDPSAIPALVDALNDRDPFVAGHAAESIAALTGQEFPGRYGTTGYHLDGNGVPLIALAAKEWWKNEGQYREWPELPSISPVSTPVPS